MFDINKIRLDFPVLVNNPDLIYFDNSATSLKPQIVIDKINHFYNYETANVHRSDCPMAFNVSCEYDECRKTIARFINANVNEIVYTKGATDGLNQIAYMLADYCLNENDVVLTSYVEHASNILPWFVLTKKKKANIKYIPTDEEGVIILSEFEKLINDRVKIIVLNHVSNVLGHQNPIKEICALAHKYNIIVVVDAAQSAPHLKIDVKDLDCDFLAFSSHKMLGPSGAGAFYGKAEILYKLEPLFYGGDSNARFEANLDLTLKKGPERFESGTPAIEQIIGFKAAIEYLEELGMDNIHDYEKELGQYLVNSLKELNNVIIYNPNTESGIVSFNIKGIFAQDAASYLGSQNICVRSGNHCAKILKEVIKTNESIRASLYFYNTKEEIDKFVKVIKETTLEKCVDLII